jgi:tripartite-type tricarboxylate transporter receptor subunit TctC
MSSTFSRVTIIVIAVLVAQFSAARGQDWPQRQVRILESLPAGVARDNVTRVVAQKLSTILGQQVLVENRPLQVLPPQSPRPTVIPLS